MRGARGVGEGSPERGMGRPDELHRGLSQELGEVLSDAAQEHWMREREAHGKGFGEKEIRNGVDAWVGAVREVPQVPGGGWGGVPPDVALPEGVRRWKFRPGGQDFPLGLQVKEEGNVDMELVLSRERMEAYGASW